MSRRKCCCCPPCDAIAAEAAEEDQPDVSANWGNPMALAFVAAASPWVWFGSVGTDPPPNNNDHYWEISLTLACESGLWNIQGHILHRYKSGGTVYSCYYQFDYSFPCVVPAPLTVNGSGYFVGMLTLPGGSAEQKLGGYNCPDNDPYADPIYFVFGP